MKDWKTTLCGVLTLVAGLAPIWAPADIAGKIQLSVPVFIGCGLFAAADATKK
jgi:hypothetical protein